MAKGGTSLYPTRPKICAKTEFPVDMFIETQSDGHIIQCDNAFFRVEQLFFVSLVLNAPSIQDEAAF